MSEGHQDSVEDHVAGATSRRAVLLGAGALGAAGLLAACGTEEPASNPTTGSATTPAGATGTTPAATPTAATAVTTPATSPTAEAVDPNAIKAADIPVGSGTIYADRKVVVTQPAAGSFKAFDATCTHQGCLVSSVQGDKIICMCHGSQFRVADGSVARGPANRPLAPKSATVNGTTIVVS